MEFIVEDDFSGSDHLKYNAVFYFEVCGNILASIIGILYCSNLLLRFDKRNFASQIHVILYWLSFEDTFANVFIILKYSHQAESIFDPVPSSREYVNWIFYLYHVNVYMLRVFNNLIILHSLILCINLFLMILLDQEIYAIIKVGTVNLFFVLSYIVYAILTVPFAFEYHVRHHADSNRTAGLDQILGNLKRSVDYQEQHSRVSQRIVSISDAAHTMWFKDYVLCYDIFMFMIPALSVIFINFVSYEIARRYHAVLHKKYNPTHPDVSFKTLIAKKKKTVARPVSGTADTFSNSRMRKLQLYMLMSISLGLLHLICLGPKVVAIIIKKVVSKGGDTSPLWVELMVSMTEILENIDSIPNFILHFYSEKVFHAMIVEKRIKKNWNQVRSNVTARRVATKF